jgi:hypothetical protein
VIIIKKLAAEFEVELTAEAGYPFENAFGLKLDIFAVVEADIVHKKYPRQKNITLIF